MQAILPGVPKLIKRKANTICGGSTKKFLKENMFLSQLGRILNSSAAEKSCNALGEGMLRLTI